MHTKLASEEREVVETNLYGRKRGAVKELPYLLRKWRDQPDNLTEKILMKNSFF